MSSGFPRVLSLQNPVTLSGRVPKCASVPHALIDGTSVPARQVGQPHTIKLLLPTADLPGQRIYQSRVAPGASAFTASPWAYGGHVFVMSEEGDTFVIEVADQYRLVRVNSLDDFSMATPAIVGDRLLIRTQHRLYSIRHRR